MQVELLINPVGTSVRNYVEWSPRLCKLRLTDVSDLSSAVNVTLQNPSTSNGGQLVFLATRSSAPQSRLQLTLPLSKSFVDFYIAGKFGFPSKDSPDARIEVWQSGSSTRLLSKSLMVRVRKNANLLTTSERDRFLNAFATLNNQGTGRFMDFRRMHLNNTSNEAHGFPGFLPWHRAYLLDLERELQRIDARVTLPYWKFDEPAPNVFTESFMGVSSDTGIVQFSSSNPLRLWATDGIAGVVRSPKFNTSTSPAGSSGVSVLSEAATFALGDDFGEFEDIEGSPHGRAHTSFSGYIASIDAAARDPLFFLVHTNVDRLWAKWQWLHNRFDINSSSTYRFMGSATSPGATRIGHNFLDTMWPWNQVTTSPRPSTAPGGTFPAQTTNSAPPSKPIVRDMIDYKGLINPAAKLGYDYDDIEFF